jgi:GntR family transcriptional regulator
VSARPLDRSASSPLWAQLEDDLLRRIEAGEFGDGRFPSDLELTESYEVSRHTVREAVRCLNQQGLVTRERGRGTIVNHGEFEQPLGTLYSLFRTIEAAGVVQTSEVLALDTVTDPSASARLGLADDAPLLLLARLRRAGGEPLAIDRAWLPLKLAKPLLNVDWSRTALYDEMTRIGAPTPNEGWERLEPALPSADDRRLLDLDEASAVFSLERLGSRDGVPVEWRTTVIRGDRYRFVSDWTARGRSELRPSTE